MGANSKTQSRRSFIKKAAVGAAITSLPVRSVWATNNNCLSGQMSGNLSQNTGSKSAGSCDVPKLTGGKDLNFWMYKCSNVQNPHSSIKHAFPQMGRNPSRRKQRDYVQVVQTCLSNNKLGISSSLASHIGCSSQLTLKQACEFSFGSHSDQKALKHGAAVYLNTFFEFYDGVTSSFSEMQSKAAAEEVANMVMNRLCMDPSWESDSNLGYTYNGYSKASSRSHLFASCRS